MDIGTDAKPLRLAAFLPYRLSVLSNTVSSAIAADYQREFGLNIWQWRVMAVIGRGRSTDPCGAGAGVVDTSRR